MIKEMSLASCLHLFSSLYEKLIEPVAVLTFPLPLSKNANKSFFFLSALLQPAVGGEKFSLMVI